MAIKNPVVRGVLSTWMRRREALGLKAGTKTEQKAQLEFILGAPSALLAAGFEDPAAHLTRLGAFFTSLGRDACTCLDAE